jgi:hypothetical protein
MRKTLIILIFITLNSCTILKSSKNTKNDTITIYGKIWDICCKDAGVVYTPERYRVLYTNNPRKVENWPDSFQYQYVKVTGILKINKWQPDTSITTKQYNYIKYFIIKPQVELIYDDSIICAIDSALGRCVEMRRFYQRLQIDRVLDSLVEGDSIYTEIADWDEYATRTANFFKYAGRKTYFLSTVDLMRREKIYDYFIIRNFSCEKDSEYDIDLTHIRIIEGVKTEKKYHISGNSKKIHLNPL